MRGGKTAGGTTQPCMDCFAECGLPQPASSLSEKPSFDAAAAELRHAINASSIPQFRKDRNRNNSLLQEALSAVPAALCHATCDQPGTLRVQCILSGLHALVVVHLHRKS